MKKYFAVTLIALAIATSAFAQEQVAPAASSKKPAKPKTKTVENPAPATDAARSASRDNSLHANLNVTKASASPVKPETVKPAKSTEEPVKKAK